LESCSSRHNFPIKSFFDDRNQLTYTFYREGQAFSVPSDPDKKDYHYTAYVGSELGQMEMYKNEVLMSQNSSHISFFKRAEDSLETSRAGPDDWYQYHSIACRGFVAWMPGQECITIIADAFIYFYRLDEGTKVPELQNVMNNYFRCTMMLITADGDNKGNWCVSYRQNQEEF
jgi:hypothetical protein